MKNVLITGGTGLIGQHLTKSLKAKGYEVSILSRTKGTNKGVTTYTWDIDKGEIEVDAIKNADYIVHLSGESIGDNRWTEKRKSSILSSRIKSANLLFHYVKMHNPNLMAFISCSAIGYYGAVTTDNIFKEDDAAASDFLGRICSQWEEVADQFRTTGIRTVKVRCAVVLTPQKGPLSKMVTPTKMGIGSGLGNGKQYLPWVHIDDLCRIFIKSIEDQKMEGAYNAVSPHHVNNTDFNRTLAGVLGKPFWMPNVPTFVLKLMFGKMSQIFLNGSRISAEKIEKAGFEFSYPNLTLALNNLLLNKTTSD